MAKIQLVGVYPTGDYASLLVESNYSPHQTKEIIKQAVFESLFQAAETEDFQMEYSYNFGDIVDEVYADESIQAKMAASGVKVVEGDDVMLDIFDHDEIWIDSDEINYR